MFLVTNSEIRDLALVGKGTVKCGRDMLIVLDETKWRTPDLDLVQRSLVENSFFHGKGKTFFTPRSHSFPTSWTWLRPMYHGVNIFNVCPNLYGGQDGAICNEIYSPETLKTR